jgi:hypothetical protein
MRLSEHFTLRELTRSDTATRLDIDNTPNADEIETLKLVAENILEPVRKHFGFPFSPNSGFRCLELNRAIKSKDTSQHVLGQAVDLEVPSISNFDLAVWIRDNVPSYDQLILEFHVPGEPTSGWVHCSFKATGNRLAQLTIGSGGTKQGLIA